MADDTVPPLSAQGIAVAEREGYWEVRFQATQSFSRIMEQMEELRLFCAVRKPGRLLLDFRGISGELTVVDRYEMGAFGERLQGLVSSVAVIAQPSIIDPNKFAVRVAQNRGLKVEVFDNLEAALRWLLKP